TAARELQAIALRRDADRVLGQLARQLLQLLGGNRERTGLVRLGRHLHADRDVQVRAAHRDRAVLRLDQDVREHGQRRARRYAGTDRGKTLLQVVARDLEFHASLTFPNGCTPGAHTGDGPEIHT